jgi:hypothetical protein
VKKPYAYLSVKKEGTKVLTVNPLKQLKFQPSMKKVCLQGFYIA